MEKNLKDKAVKGVVWTTIEKFFNQIVSLVIGIFIARILNPSDYGIIGMTAIFMAVAYTFQDSGFGSALISKKDRTEKDFNTCFYFNLSVGVIVYILFFFTAPFIADFYHTPVLTKVIRVLSLTFIINAFSYVQSVKLKTSLRFKEVSIISVVSAISTGLLGLIMAIAGFGVWALVFQSIAGSLLNLALLEYFTRWKPKFNFSKASFRYLFGYGSKILCSSLINTIYGNLYTLVIGRVYNPREVGLYNRGNQFAYLPSGIILDTIMRVAFPVLAEIQDDKERLTNAYKKFLRIPIFILFPILMILAVLAEPFISLLLGEKWLACVPFLQILALGACFTPLTHINLNVLYVKKRTDLVLKLEIMKKTIAFTILFSMIQFGIIWLIIGKAVYEFIAYSFNCYYTGKFLNFGFWHQIYYIIPVALKAAICAGLAFFVTLLFESAAMQLLIGIIVGLGTYYLIAVTTKDQSYNDLKQIITAKFMKRKTVDVAV